MKNGEKRVWWATHISGIYILLEKSGEIEKKVQKWIKIWNLESIEWKEDKFRDGSERTFNDSIIINITLRDWLQKEAASKLLNSYSVCNKIWISGGED